MLLRSTCARDGCMRAYVVCMRMLRVYVGACVSGCACIHVFAHNTIAWMCIFNPVCACMYAQRICVWRVPVRACAVHAHKNAIVNVKTFNCLYMSVCVCAHTHVRAYACVLVCACVYVHASCACSQKED